MSPRLAKKNKPAASRTLATRARKPRAIGLEFAAARSEGGLITYDALARVAARDPGVPGVADGDFNLLPGERLNEHIAGEWNKLQRTWALFQEKRQKLDATDFGTTLTRKDWLVPLFTALGYQPLTPRKKAIEIGDKSYRISHEVPTLDVALHFVSFNQSLDKRYDEDAAEEDLARHAAAVAKRSPHSLVQEFLNRSDRYLWGILSNGLKVRFLRDNEALARPAFLEFDLETIMNTESYGDFFLFYLVAHASRFQKKSAPTDEETGTDGDDENEDDDKTASSVDLDPPIERWRRLGIENGARALDELARAVVDAINALGKGFLARRENAELNKKLKTGALSKLDYYRQLLRIVYRIVFVLIAEDRDLIFPRDPKDPSRALDERKKNLYMSYYSVSRVRALSRRQRGGRHCDLWEQLKLVLGSFQKGDERLGIPAFESSLFDRNFAPDLQDLKLSNSSLLAAVRALTHTTRNNVLQPVDYRNLGAEELGSVYESLLEMQPEKTDPNDFSLVVVAGNDRKTTGSFYTPSDLVSALLDSALDPVVDAALAAVPKIEIGKNDSAETIREKRERNKEERANAILNLKICDPSCGSGHFLVGAARRLGKRLAAVRAGDEHPAPDLVREAVRDVVARCLYGVDLNPMAVELCKVALWIESMTPGKNLAFLDHRILVGNSLLGASPQALAEGIPDGAFAPLLGDDKKACELAKKRNADQRRALKIGQTDISNVKSAPKNAAASLLDHLNDAFAGQESALDVDATDESQEDGFDKLLRVESQTLGKEWRKINDVKGGEHEYENRRRFYEETLKKGEIYARFRFATSLYCAAFVREKTSEKNDFITTAILQKACREGKRALTSWKDVEALADEYDFFSWQIEFPDVFLGVDDPGFDCVLGNPPWERVKLQEKEWFAQRSPEIANAKNKAERQKLIDALATDENVDGRKILEEFQLAKRKAEATSAFIRLSGRFPLCGKGDVNTYAIFAELNRSLISSQGRVGCIVPSGIATDATTKDFFADIFESRSIISLYDFQNYLKLFRDVTGAMKFSLLTLSQARKANNPALFSFFNLSVKELKEAAAADRVFTLTSEDIRSLNPNTRTCPIFRTGRDAELTKALYRRVPTLIVDATEGSPERNPWKISFKSMFHMSNDSHLFRTRDDLESLPGFERAGARYVNAQTGAEFWPLYEAKMTHHYNARFGDYADLPEGSKSTQLPDVPKERLLDPSYSPSPRYWVEKSCVLEKLPNPTPKFLIGFRGITNVTNQRTVIAALMPTSGCGNSINTILFNAAKIQSDFRHIAYLYGNLCSFVFDYVARQKIGGMNLNSYIFKQFSVLEPQTYDKPSPFAFRQTDRQTDRQTGLCRYNPSEPQTFADFIYPRVLELAYVSDDLRGFAESVGYDGAPFRWDERRRFVLMRELDALFFGLYLGFGEWRPATVAEESYDARRRLLSYFPAPIDALDHVMSTFPIVRRKELDDESLKSWINELAIKNGRPAFNFNETYPSHALVRAFYEDMVQAAQNGKPWRSWLDD